MAPVYTIVVQVTEAEILGRSFRDRRGHPANLKSFEKGFDYGVTAHAGTPASLEMDPHLIYLED
jgi:hypothetical protein